MPYPSQIVPSQTIPYGSGTYRAIDYCQNGVWWSVSPAGISTLNFYVSTDQGQTWSFVQSVGVGDAISGYAIFIDKDDYCHLIVDTFFTAVGQYCYYFRGTPNASRTTWSWNNITNFFLGDFAGGMPVDVVAFRNPVTGWDVWLTVNYLWNANPTWGTLLGHIELDAAGNLFDLDTHDAGWLSPNAWGAVLDFRHPANDPKLVQSGTPHLYVMSVAQDQASACYFRKWTWTSGSAWSAGTLRQIDASAQWNRGSIVYDGTRVVMSHVRTASNTQPRIDERDEADTTTTNRDPVSPNDGVIAGQPDMTTDPTGNIYLFWVGQTSRDVKVNVYNRAGGAWTGWVTKRVGTIADNTLGGTGHQPSASLLPLTYYDSAISQQLFDRVDPFAVHSDWSAPASATTQGGNTGTIASTLRPIDANATATSSSGAFTPLSIAGCKAWYDFTDTTTLYQDSAGSVPVTADGQPIGWADDKSGTNHDLQQLTSAARPTYKTNILNGRAVARFDGVDDFFSVVMGADTSWTLFFALKKRSAPGASRTLFSVDDAASLYTNSASGTGFFWWTSEIDTEITVGGTPSDTNIITLSIASTLSMSIRVNSAGAVTFDPDDRVTTGATYQIGRTSAGSQFADYDIGEIIAYDTALSDTNRNLVYAYLESRWLSAHSDWSAPASATTQAPTSATGTIASTLPKLITAAYATGPRTLSGFSAPASATTQAPPGVIDGHQSNAFQNDAFQVLVITGPITGLIASTLPALTQSATATGPPPSGTIASTLPKLTQAATAVSGAGLVGTIANTLPKLTQAATAATAANTATVASTLPKLTQAVSATTGILNPGTIANTLPKLTQAATAINYTVIPRTATVASSLPALRTSVSAFVEEAQPPVPPTPPGVQGLVHIFQNDATSRLLPASNSPVQYVGGFRDRASMVGGFQSASGTISETEFDAHPTVYTPGTTWLVKSLALEDAGLDPYIFAGELKETHPAGGVVELAADGWGLLQDRQVERFLLASMAIDQWAPGDEDPFNFPPHARIASEIKTNRIVFEVARFTSFKKNDAGQPSVWRSTPVVFWAPKIDLRWIKFTIRASGRNVGKYDLELVGTPVGPTGNLTVLQTWNLNNNLNDDTKSFQIPAGYDLIGLRVIRQTEAKRVPHSRVVLTNVIVGAYATSEPYTLTQAFTTLFGLMGVNSMAVASDTQDVLPYDAARVPLSDIADDLGVFGQWYWRIWANATGGKKGEAGPIGQTEWSVSLVHTPVRPLPQPRYNVVQFDYKYGGGYTSQSTVRANPDPYPGTDIIYVLDLPDPPILPLATRFAQKVANLVSQPWMSGSGTLFKVDPGNRPAAVVKPGDRLTLTNYDSTKVIVDEIAHSEDGNLVEVSFAESSKIVDRWLALWEQKINQGLSPNAAAMALLDSADPKPPVVTAGYVIGQKREGRRDYDLQATATLVTEDIEGEGTYVDRYGFRARPIDPSDGTPIPRNKGGGWRERTMRAPRDDEAEETKEVTWEKIENPKKWAWEVQGWAVDALGQKSTKDSEFPGKPADFLPVTPQSVSLDVDQRSMTVTHVIPPDPDDPTEEDQSYDHADIRINDQDGNWNNALRIDRKVKGETKRFRFHKPIQGTYYARVLYVDFWGNKSAPVVVSNAKKIPPLPSIGSWSFDAGGTRHARFRLRVPVTVNDAGHDDHVKRILVQMSHGPNNTTPGPGDKKVRDWVRIDDDPQEALFRNIPKRHYVFVRAMSVDSDQKESGWTAWVALGRPNDAGLTDAPATPTGLAGNVRVTAPRRIVADWDDPDDDDAIRWRVVVRRASTIMEDRSTRNTRFVYRVPKADVGANHTVQVYAINALNRESTPTGQEPAVPIDEPGGGVATNPPNVPSNPSFTADGRGTRHAKYRIIVTAGTSTVDANHDAPHRYVIQLAHDAVDSGQNPPAGSKRQHGNVEGDATGDDLQEVFRNIPKRHHVWVRQRARNAAGASDWTGWRTSSRPIDFGVAVIPADPTGVDVDTTSANRRVIVTWDDPGQDDEAVRWRVEIRRGGATVKTIHTRTTRCVYHVPKAFEGVAHRARVFAISDTGHDSSQVESLDGVVEPDAAGWEAGDLRPRARAHIPPNWLNCNGQSVGTTTWPNLFAAIGYAFGGSGSTFLLPDLRGRKNVGVSSLVALASNEGQAEGARIEDHDHPESGQIAVPGNDDAAGALGQDPTPENVSHHHQLAVGGSNTDTFTHNQVSARQGNLAGNVLTTPAGHQHQLQGQTNDTPEQHWHLHAHGIEHIHGHGHNAGHGHNGSTGSKKGNFLGHHWLVYAA